MLSGRVECVSPENGKERPHHLVRGSGAALMLALTWANAVSSNVSA